MFRRFIQGCPWWVWVRSQLAYVELTCGTDMCVRACEWSYRVDSVVGFACSRTWIVSVRGELWTRMRSKLSNVVYWNMCVISGLVREVTCASKWFCSVLVTYVFEPVGCFETWNLQESCVDLMIRRYRRSHMVLLRSPRLPAAWSSRIGFDSVWTVYLNTIFDVGIPNESWLPRYAYCIAYFE